MEGGLREDGLDGGVGSAHTFLFPTGCVCELYCGDRGGEEGPVKSEMC